ncbi:TraR/DksA C4-type zinc finger protein [Clostridium sp.]|uniref:TraR/DksA C4-type zinc finger protein n=1 Tax=Clostridium sp. TaxID=1506 RepID=UPI003D6CB887
MDKEKTQYYKEKLISEKSRVNSLINTMKQNGVINSNSEMASELSFYDNHPSDSASELFDKEKGLALKKNEVSIINKIEDSLKNIENGTYGKCKSCGSDIIEERLEFIPYAENCATCQKTIDSNKPAEQNNRPVEEEVIGTPFRYSYSGEASIDAEDTYQIVEHFNKLEDTAESYEEDEDGYVEPIEKISNEQYRNQLPD